MPVSIKHLRQLAAKDHGPMQLFARWEGDGLYYQVHLVKLDDKVFKATVRYEDGSEFKVKTSSLHLQFSADDFPYKSEDEIICCICEGGDSAEPNDLILCDICQQGFHQECHDPRISSEDIAGEWSCDTCDYMLKQLMPKVTSSTPKIKSRPPKKPLRVSLKPIKAPKKKAELPVGSSIDGGSQKVRDAAKALVQTEEFMGNLTDKDNEERIIEEVIPVGAHEEHPPVEEDKEQAEPGKRDDGAKKKKATKGAKAKKIPQPA